MSKQVLVSWSGGVDSTYMIYEYLSKGYHVDAVYTKILNNETKTNRELVAIRKMVKRYFKKYSFRLLSNTKLYIPGTTTNVCLQQVIPFLISLIYSYNRHDEVAIGYVMGDDAISYLPEIRKIWSSMNLLSINKVPKLSFPLIKVGKESTYTGLPSQIRELVTWCESSNVEDRCGLCVPCKKMIYYKLFGHTKADDEIVENPSLSGDTHE